MSSNSSGYFREPKPGENMSSQEKPRDPGEDVMDTELGIVEQTPEISKVEKNKRESVVRNTPIPDADTPEGGKEKSVQKDDSVDLDPPDMWNQRRLH